MVIGVFFRKNLINWDQISNIYSLIVIMVLVAAGQLSATSSLSTNLGLVLKLISKAVKLNAKVLFLPEASDYIARNAAHSIKISRPLLKSVFVTGIQKKLRELHSQGTFLNVVVGIHEPAWKDEDDVKSDASGTTATIEEASRAPSTTIKETKDTSEKLKRVQNLLLYINEKGEIIEKYQKIHLFDIAISNGPILKESNSVEPGNVIPKPFETPIGKLGLAICYDIRFPELAIKHRDEGAQIITYPSAFTVKTGSAHWHLLGRARAIDSQSYVILPAQKGSHDTTIEDVEDENGNVVGVKSTVAPEEKLQKRVSYGHTAIIDPWGSIVAEASDVNVNNSEPDIIVADIDLDIVETVRRDMPLKDHRRRDLFNHI